MQTAVNRNGCIPSSPGAASCPAEKLGPNFIADAAVPAGDPCFLEVAAVVNSKDLPHKTLFFRWKFVSDGQSQHLQEDQKRGLVADKTERAGSEKSREAC